MRVILLVLLLSVVAAVACSENEGQTDTANTTPNSVQAQTPISDAGNTPDKAAERGLATLRKLATERTFSDLGFESLAEVERISLAPAFRVFFVRLDTLRNFREGDSAGDLLTDGKRFLYPVMVDGEPRSAMTVELLNGRWEAVSFGGGGIVAESAKLREMKSLERKVEYVVVQVPAMQLNFLGHGVGGTEILLTPLPSNADADQRAAWFHGDKTIVGVRADPGGQDIRPSFDISLEYLRSRLDRKAEDVFSKLAPKAKEIRDDVPR